MKNTATARPATSSPTTYPAINWQPETLAALEHLRSIAPGTVAEQSALSGFRMAEPVLVMIDSAIRYAKAFRAEFERPIADDYMARDEFAAILSGVRALLNFDGAAMWEANHNSGTHRTRDTKDNGMIESLFWTACEIAGIDGNDI
jgi:hypothetical protein